MKFLKKLWNRLVCAHKRGVFICITFDGVAIYECSNCGKLIEKGFR